MPKLTVMGDVEDVPEVEVNWTKWHQMPANQERVKATAAKMAGERDFSVGLAMVFQTPIRYDKDKNVL